MLGLYAIYAAVAVWWHPDLIYPFDPTPFAAEGYEIIEADVGDQAVSLAVSQGRDNAPAVLFFMGNTGSLARFPTSITQHQAAGRFVVALQYPGGAGVPGAPSEGLLKAQALAAFDWLDQQTDGPIFLHGYSLGTGLAVHVAARRDVDGVMLDAPYTRLCTLMARQALLPACQIPLVQKWKTVDDLEGITAPIEVRHGDQDEIIPASDGRALVAAMEAAGLDVTFHLVPGGTHNNIFRTDGYWARTAAFMAAD